MGTCCVSASAATSWWTMSKVHLARQGEYRATGSPWTAPPAAIYGEAVATVPADPGSGYFKAA